MKRFVLGGDALHVGRLFGREHGPWHLGLKIGQDAGGASDAVLEPIGSAEPDVRASALAPGSLRVVTAHQEGRVTLAGLELVLTIKQRPSIGSEYPDRLLGRQSTTPERQAATSLRLQSADVASIRQLG